MKNIFFVLFFGPVSLLYGQTRIEQSFDASSVDKIKLDFHWSELIKINRWNGSTVKISGSVLINNGENDQAFRLRSSQKEGILYVDSEIENIDEIPNRISIKAGGTTHYFNTDDRNDPAVRQLMRDLGGKSYQYMSVGVIKEIELQVWVPENKFLEVNARHGLLEIVNPGASLEAYAKHGGIDITLSNDIRQVEAKTKYGQIYSNLPYVLKSDEGKITPPNQWMVVKSGKKNGSSSLILVSKHGDIFLRKKGTN